MYVTAVKNNVVVECSFEWNAGYSEEVLPFTNNIPQKDGGTHLLGFRTALTRVINKYTADRNNKKNKMDTDPFLPKGTAEENFNYALDLASQLDFQNAEKAFKEFLKIHKESDKSADAQYWLGRVYFAQKKFEEAAIALAEFNSVFPNDPRFQETTLLIAESAVNFAPKDQLCDILKQSLEFMVNPSEKFVKRINILKNEKQCTTG